RAHDGLMPHDDCRHPGVTGPMRGRTRSPPRARCAGRCPQPAAVLGARGALRARVTVRVSALATRHSSRSPSAPGMLAYMVRTVVEALRHALTRLPDLPSARADAEEL